MVISTYGTNPRHSVCDSDRTFRMYVNFDRYQYTSATRRVHTADNYCITTAYMDIDKHSRDNRLDILLS